MADFCLIYENPKAVIKMDKISFSHQNLLRKIMMKIVI